MELVAKLHELLLENVDQAQTKQKKNICNQKGAHHVLILWRWGNICESEKAE
jgi:hypothetical protein